MDAAMENSKKIAAEIDKNNVLYSLKTQKQDLEIKIQQLVTQFIQDTGFIPEIKIEPVYQIFDPLEIGGSCKKLIRVEVCSKLLTP